MKTGKLKVVGQVVELPVGRVSVSPMNVRDERRSVKIDDLKLSIKRVGLLQPIVAFEKNGKFEVIVGQRRVLAYQQLNGDEPDKYHDIKAILIPEPDERTARLMSLVENLQRSDLTASEKTRACTTLLKELGTVRAVAEALGWAPQTVTQWLRFDALVPTELKELVDQKKMSRPDAMKISAATYPNLERAIDIGRSMVKGKFSDPEKERLVEFARAKPRASVLDLIREAKKPLETLSITFHLAGIYKTGLEKAVREGKEHDTNSMAQRIVKDWLDERGYTRK